MKTLITICLTAICLTAIALLFLIWQGQVKLGTTGKLPTTWDYSEFTFGKSIQIDEISGQWVSANINYYDWQPTSTNQLNMKKVEGRRVVSVSDVLSTLGRDGWELASSDGNHYVVKRPQGHWRHDHFSVDYLPYTNSATTKP